MDLGSTGDATPTGETFLVHEAFAGYWIDTEKNPLSLDDDHLCWAAAAANVLEFTGWGVVSDMTTAEEMFSYTQDYWTDNGGLPGYAWQWWFDGTDQSPAGPDWSYMNVSGGGNFYPEYGFGGFYYAEDESDMMLASLDQYLHNGYGVTAGLYLGDLGHAVTVWGVNYNPSNPGKYYGIWITDSDDGKQDVDAEDQLRYYEVAFDTGTWYLQGYGGSNSWEIGTVQALAPKSDRYDLWQYASDPETDASQLTYQIIGNTNPECGVSIVANRFLSISPEANWHGESEITIEVSDGEYTAHDTMTITVESVNDAPVIESIAGESHVEEQTNVSLSAVASDVDHATLTYTWDFGDGSDAVSGPDLTEMNHAYGDVGTYTVKLTVTDGEGAQDEATWDIVVHPRTSPIVETVTIGDGTIQRSTIRSINIDFDQPCQTGLRRGSDCESRSTVISRDQSHTNRA